MLQAKGALAVLTKLVWENMKTRCATSRQRLLSRLTTVERAWRPLVSDCPSPHMYGVLHS
jgi:hypothetical protein